MNLEKKFESAKNASLVMRSIDSLKKIELIKSVVDHVGKHSDKIISTNRIECENAKKNGLTDSQIDRLILDQKRIDAMMLAGRNVAELDDPVGEVLETFFGAKNIEIKKVRVPMGLVAVIYENRPNVTLDAVCIALKSSNAVILRGSSSAHETNTEIILAIKEGISAIGLDENIVSFIDDPSHESAIALMQAKGYVDVLIPRGGPSLINSIETNATVPYVIDGAGNCHVYVDSKADISMALDIVINSKTQRTSVCNACESLVVHNDIAQEFIPMIVDNLFEAGVLIHGDKKSCDIISECSEQAMGATGSLILATEEDFAKEYLGLEISIIVVESLSDAIEHINKNSTGHTESIVTSDLSNAQQFMNGIESAVVMHNTSTRFTDGERFGFGAEIGNSTQKLHARGPMALKELTTYQYRVSSNGETV